MFDDPGAQVAADRPQLTHPRPELMAPVGLITPEVCEQYRRDGVVFIPQALHPDWLLLIELPFWREDSSPLRALIQWAIIFSIVAILFNYVALVNFGIYAGLFAPSLVLVGARVVERVAEHTLRSNP